MANSWKGNLSLKSAKRKKVIVVVFYGCFVHDGKTSDDGPGIDSPCRLSKHQGGKA